MVPALTARKFGITPRIRFGCGGGVPLVCVVGCEFCGAPCCEFCCPLCCEVCCEFCSVICSGVPESAMVCKMGAHKLSPLPSAVAVCCDASAAWLKAPLQCGPICGMPSPSSREAAAAESPGSGSARGASACCARAQRAPEIIASAASAGTAHLKKRKDGFLSHTTVIQQSDHKKCSKVAFPGCGARRCRFPVPQMPLPASAYIVSGFCFCSSQCRV